MARITRKELKSDHFALEVEHTLTFFEEHREQLVKYAIGAVVLVLLIVGYLFYSRHQHTIREEALARAIQVQEAPVGQQGAPGTLSFPTQDAKDQEANRVFTQVMNDYPGSSEGEVARYYLGAIKADEGKLAEAETYFKKAADQGDKNYASLAKLSLAQIYLTDGRNSEAEKTLRDLMDHPTVFVSKEQATFTLARMLIATKRPAEARKLLDPLRAVPGVVGQIALNLYNEMPPQ